MHSLGSFLTGYDILPSAQYKWIFFFFFQAPDSYKNVTDVVNTCKLIEHCCTV